LLPDGRFDLDALRRFRHVAAGAELTVHRCFDVHPGVEENVADLLDVGVDRLLTSGGAASAHDGTDRIARAVATGAGRITVMAGGGVDPDRVPDLVRRTGITDVHLSARTLVAADEGFGPRYRTDPEVLARVIA
jgi:copper homeostasis protein